MSPRDMRLDARWVISSISVGGGLLWGVSIDIASGGCLGFLKAHVYQSESSVHKGVDDVLFIFCLFLLCLCT